MAVPRRRALRYFAASVILLPLLCLCGCATMVWSHTARRPERIEQIQRACIHGNELAVAYSLVRYARHERITWFTYEPDSSLKPTLRHKRDAEPPMLLAADAVPIPVKRLAPGERAVLAEGSVFSLFERRGPAGARVFALLRRRDGTVDSEPMNIRQHYRAWWFYPLLPFTVAWDAITLPVQAVLLRIHWPG